MNCSASEKARSRDRIHHSSTAHSTLVDDRSLAGKKLMTHSVLLTGASGTGKSSLIRGALELYGSGIVVLAPGFDELDSYRGLSASNYAFQGFDDVLYQPALGDKVASGHTEMVKWLKERYLEIKADVTAGKPPPYAV